MIEGKFNIVFSGRILPNRELADVQAQLARLFKTGLPQIEKLFGGQDVTIKKNLDYAQAMKYQSALKQAGALVLIQKVAAEQPAKSAAAVQKPTEQQEQANQSADSNTQTAGKPDQPAAVKPATPEPSAKESSKPNPFLAAVEADNQPNAAATSSSADSIANKIKHDKSRGKAVFGQSEPLADREPLAEQEPTATQEASADQEPSLANQESSASKTESTGEGSPNQPDSSWSLADAGERLPEQDKPEPIAEPDLSELNLDEVGAVLGEQKEFVEADVDTSQLSISDSELLNEPKAFVAREVDTSDLSMSEAGERITNEKVSKELVNPDISHLKMS
jgi:hypothetical protein